MGTLRAVEHDRREDSHDQPVASHAEATFREEKLGRVTEDRPARPEPDYERHDDAEHRHSEEAQPREHRPSDDDRAPEDSEGPPRPYDPAENSGAEGTPSSSGSSGRARPRSRSRGRGRRLPPRERRVDDRRRPRESRPPYSAQGSESGGHENHREREGRPESHLPAETRSLLELARGELEQVREVLEGVLKDLDNVAEQLTRAEHEKDVAEAEIEQLRESLRRLHR